ncbi:MAG TPA: ABC transporter permease [Acidimicrobiia bacterium]|jgi:ABC-2 type transport system permease protein|nr:ABC transporter permease [Acidimicrobiia bacterium]
MAATLQLTKTESKLFVRDPIALFFGLVFPAVLLFALGYLYPGFDEPSADLDGKRYIDVYAPIALVLGLATLGLVTMPPIFGAYRQFGILRRLRTTPVHPVRLLSAQLIVHVAVAVAAAALAIGVVVTAFDVPVPESPLWFLLSFLLAAASIFAIGLLVGARASTQVSGQAIGMAIYFPMLFFAGVWIPRSVMPDGLLAVSDLTPLGSAVQALEDSWFGATPSLLNLTVMLAYALVVGLVAVRGFRWE